MQPTQLSLLPDQVPAPPTQILEEVPEPDVAAAVAALARVIAKTAGGRDVGGTEGGGE